MQTVRAGLSFCVEGDKSSSINLVVTGYFRFSNIRNAFCVDMEDRYDILAESFTALT